jgi:hypothetical protein
VGQLCSGARDAEGFWASIYDSIRPYEYDFPTAILYSHWATDTMNSSCSSHIASRDYKLEWTIGYTENHPGIPKILNLRQDHGLARAMSESTKDGVAKLFRMEDNVLPISVFRDVEKRAFGDPCKAFIVIPMKTSNDIVTGYIVVGLNTRRPYDTEYQDWIEVFSNLLGASAASIALHEEEVRRRKLQEEQAAKDREVLSAEVAVLTQEASTVAEKLQNFHDIANAVGLGYFEFDISGQLMHANVSISCFPCFELN